MKSLRFRIGLIWLCYFIVGVGFATDLIKYKSMIWVVVFCGFASVALRFVKPAFPARTHPGIQAWILLPIIALLICANHLLTDPLRKQVLFIGWLLAVAASLLIQAYEDKRVWKSGKTES